MLKKSLFVAAVICTSSFAQDFVYCAKPLAQKSMVAQIEGNFVNEKFSRVNVNIEWRHNTAVADSFFISVPNKEKILYVTAGDYRYKVYTSTGAKRQIGGRHLREKIGELPIKFDDLELLANGWFLCPDSTANDPKVLTTAIPETQAVLTLDTLPLPTNIAFKRWNDNRTYEILEWKDFSGTTLPTALNITSDKFSGTVRFNVKPDSAEQAPAASQTAAPSSPEQTPAQ